MLVPSSRWRQIWAVIHVFIFIIFVLLFLLTELLNCLPLLESKLITTTWTPPSACSLSCFPFGQVLTSFIKADEVKVKGLILWVMSLCYIAVELEQRHTYSYLIFMEKKKELTQFHFTWEYEGSNYKLMFRTPLEPFCFKSLSKFFIKSTYKPQ